VKQSEMAMGQRSVVYSTSSTVYQRSFAFSAVFGIFMVICGIGAFVEQMPVAGAICIGLGAIFVINSLGMARASKNFKKLAAEGRDQGPTS